MITPELIVYIRGELAKGRAREDIRQGLVKDGGWSDADLSEAFRMVIPMQGFGEQSVPNPKIETKTEPKAEIKIEPKIEPLSQFSEPIVSHTPSFSAEKVKKIFLIIGIVVIIGGLGFAVWFYRAPLLSFWNSGTAKVSGFFGSLFSPKPAANTENKTPVSELPPAKPVQTNTPPVVTVKNCGTSLAPDLKKPSTYQNNATLNCLADSALRCENAKAVLTDPLFPTVFQVVKNETSCDFQLSYPADSVLVDATGAKLSGQYITCPISAVKAVDETKKPPTFSAPSVNDLGKYAGQIYFYGTLGVFIETNLDQSKIRSVGCSGAYIDSVISSYRKMQSKQ